MIHYLSYQKGELVEVDYSQSFDWINIFPPFSPHELEKEASRLDLPIDFFTDSLDIDERSRYEREEEGNLILINAAFLNHDSKDNEAIYVTVPIGIILSRNVIITISQSSHPIFDKFRNKLVKNFDPKNHRRFILQMFEQNVYGFLDGLKKLNLKRNLIEQELYNSSRNSELKQLLRIEKSLVFFVNSLRANDLLMMKMKRTDFLSLKGDEVLEDFFEDIIIDNSQALEMSNVYTNILSSTMEAYASIISNNLNIFIHRLTIITIILMVPTLVASFYGMNLEHIPFSSGPYTFYVLIFFSIILGLALIYFFRRARQ